MKAYYNKDLLFIGFELFEPKEDEQYIDVTEEQWLDIISQVNKDIYIDPENKTYSLKEKVVELPPEYQALKEEQERNIAKQKELEEERNKAVEQIKQSDALVSQLFGQVLSLQMSIQMIMAKTGVEPPPTGDQPIPFLGLDIPQI